jgi:sarcosine oxidase
MQVRNFLLPRGIHVNTHRSRRCFLKGSAFLGATYFAGPSRFTRSSQPSIVVVGAGAFGGWSALQLVQRGANVTLFDAWGPGNSRASSGGETRTIRGSYGPAQALYASMVARALQLWQEYERECKALLSERSTPHGGSG